MMLRAFPHFPLPAAIADVPQGRGSPAVLLRGLLLLMLVFLLTSAVRRVRRLLPQPTPDLREDEPADSVSFPVCGAGSQRGQLTEGVP